MRATLMPAGARKQRKRLGECGWAGPAGSVKAAAAGVVDLCHKMDQIGL